MALPMTVGNRLRKQYFPCPPSRDDHSLDEYIDELKRLGVQVHPGLKPAFFKIRNGLEYPGLMTTENLHGGEVLVRVPKHLLLTTAVALKQPALQQLYREAFFMKALYWQHRILMTYLLWTYQQRKGIWYEMVKNMSRDVDLICLWNDQDAREVNDTFCYRASRGDNKSFLSEWEQFAIVMKKHKVIDKKHVTLDNYRWLYAHLFSRCFGRSECITLVPFCQLFNHHISRVFYDMDYEPGNPFKYLETKYEKQPLPKQDEELSTSNESDRSCDYENEEEWDYSNVPIEKLSWGAKQDEKLDVKERQAIQISKEQIKEQLINTIDWFDGGVLFAGQMLHLANLFYSEYLAGRMPHKETVERFGLLKQQATLYRQLIIKYNEKYRSKGWRYSVRNDNVPYRHDSGLTKYPTYQPQKADYFVMRLHRKDHFLKNNQVYFRYSRLSSRKMLQCYGMTIEGNKYQHLWVRLDLLPYLREFPDILLEMKQRRISHIQKFKLKRREFSLEIMLFSRLVTWRSERHSIKDLFSPSDLKRELEAVQFYKDLLVTLLKDYPTRQVLQAKLLDPQTGYHRYFCVVYQLEKVRVLELHLRLLEIIVQVIHQLHKGTPIAQATKTPATGDQQQYWMLRNYFSSLLTT